MDFANIKLPIAVIGVILAQAFGIIWYVAEETIEEMGETLEEISKTQAIIDNEMRTIMSDHSGFGEVLKSLGETGALPSGERRSYGGYR